MKTRKNVGMIQTPDKGQSDKWDFPVYQEELKTSRGNASGIHAVIRGDSHEVIGQYKGQKVLEYPALVESFEKALTAADFTFSKSFLTTGNGARFFGRYDIGNGLHAANDGFRKIIRLQSSHDGTLLAGFQFEAERLACLNGMIGLAAVVSMFKRHSETLDLGFISNNLRESILRGEQETTAVVEKMAVIPVTEGDARNVVSNIVKLGNGNGVSEKAGHLIFNNWRNPSADEKPLGDTLYRLYNAATRFTRDVQNKGRFELSRRANIHITGCFSLATKSESNYNRLFAKAENPLDFDAVTVG